MKRSRTEEAAAAPAPAPKKVSGAQQQVVSSFLEECEKGLLYQYFKEKPNSFNDILDFSLDKFSSEQRLAIYDKTILQISDANKKVKVINDFFRTNHAEMYESDQAYVSKFYLGPERTDFMTVGDLNEEKIKLGKMINMIDNALALREAAPKTAILHIVSKKIDQKERLNQQLQVSSESQEALIVDAPPTPQQQQQHRQLRTAATCSSSSSPSLFSQVTTISATAVPRSDSYYTPAEMATTASEAYAVRVALVEEKEK